MSYFRVPVRVCVWSCSGILSCVLRVAPLFPCAVSVSQCAVPVFRRPVLYFCAQLLCGGMLFFIYAPVFRVDARVAVRMLLYAVSGAPLSVFWLAFGPVLPVDYPGADQLGAVVPRGELPCGDAALRPVEDDVAALFRDVQHAALQRLPVADAHREAGAAARL